MTSPVLLGTGRVPHLTLLMVRVLWKSPSEFLFLESLLLMIIWTKKVIVMKFRGYSP